MCSTSYLTRKVAMINRVIAFGFACFCISWGMIMAKVQDRVFLSKCVCHDETKRPVCDFAELSKKKLLTLSEKLLTSQIVCVGVNGGGNEGNVILPTFTSLLLPLDRVLQPASNGALNIDGVMPELREMGKAKIQDGVVVESKRKRSKQSTDCVMDGMMCSAPNGVRFLFPSAILVDDIIVDEKTSKYNENLKAMMLKLEEERDGCPFHLHDGYRTKDGLFDRKDPAITWLKTQISQRLSRLLELSNSSQLSFTLDGWGQVLRAGDGQEPHVHPSSLYAGVYYITAPKEVLESGKSGGCLRFFDPRPGALMAQAVRGKNLYGDAIEVCPDERGGTLVLFPSYLMHSVVPMPSNYQGPRIALSFNAIHTP